MKPLSRDLTAYKQLCVIVAVVLPMLFVASTYLPAEDRTITGNEILGCSIAETCILLPFYILTKIRIVEFDENYLHVTFKNERKVIPLKNVEAIKLTVAEINDDFFWKLVYTFDGQIDTVRFLPTDNFDDFIEAVQNKNPNVVIRRWAIGA